MSRSADIVVVHAEIARIAREPVLSPAEERRARAMPAALAAAFVAGRSLARRLLARFLLVDPRPIRIVDEPDEKPRLDGCSELDFNVAHAGGLVVAAVARGRRVGVDVEPVSPRRPIEAIAEEAFGPEAADELRWLPAYRRADRFTCWWVRAEALCKATGDGLHFPIDDAYPAGFAVRDLVMPAGYRAAVAFDGGVPAELQWSAA
jgi:4'-phosphopantetheinyl transferase